MRNPGFARRNNISVVVLVVVVIYGFYELYNAFGNGSQDQMAAMFGVLFVGGGIYGAYTIWTEARDQVTAIDADFDTGRAAITLWRPFKSMVIDVPIDRLTGLAALGEGRASATCAPTSSSSTPRAIPSRSMSS